jgi:hypothetical protein
MSGKLLLFWAVSLMWLILDFFMSLEYNPDQDNRINFITGFDAVYYLLTGVLPVALGVLIVWKTGQRSRSREAQEVVAGNLEG